MVIDIDIKIANNDGKLIHRFVKRFDEKQEVSEKIEKDAGLGKDFEDFLAEYLSVSGRTIREKLIYPDMQDFGQSNMDLTEDESLFREEDESDGITDSEMEYKIRIGNNKVIAGKIPFHRLTRLNKLLDTKEKADNAEAELPDKNWYLNQSDYKNLYQNNSYDFRNKETADIEKNLKNMMIQAVEKYELNFYHSSEEPEKN